ncbi:MAG: PD-(D/E)XK nuclease family protein [Flavisolibacter sp.]
MYKLSPSDLTFSWDGCKYCFYLKVKHNIALRGVFPGIFGKMANLTSEFYLGKPTSEISPDLPPGAVKLREKFVKSAPISVPGAASQCYINGRFDAVLEFEDGSYGIVDYKTSEAKDEHADFYSRQLSAYAYALEHPAPKALSLSPISRLGLFVVTPGRFERTSNNEMVFVNKTTWMDVPRDDDAFLVLLGEVLAVLDAPAPPKSSEDCELCNYRNSMHKFMAG